MLCRFLLLSVRSHFMAIFRIPLFHPSMPRAKGKRGGVHCLKELYLIAKSEVGWIIIIIWTGSADSKDEILWVHSRPSRRFKKQQDLHKRWNSWEQDSSHNSAIILFFFSLKKESKTPNDAIKDAIASLRFKYLYWISPSRRAPRLSEFQVAPPSPSLSTRLVIDSVARCL